MTVIEGERSESLEEERQVERVLHAAHQTRASLQSQYNLDLPDDAWVSDASSDTSNFPI